MAVGKRLHQVFRWHGPPDELTSILGRTLGVPIFQEQAMKIALDAAKFNSKEANHLRKAMATFRSRGMVHELEDLMVGRMVERGYTERQVRRLVEWYMRVKQAG